MPATVYFATNRTLAGPADDWRSYGAGIVAPSDPGAVTYGTAFVNDAGLTADTTGAITTIQDVSKGDFGATAKGDLSAPGCNLMVFIHGFDNSFENAITRAAYIQQWFAGSGVAGANTKVIAFSWPSLGKLLSFPVPWDDYLRDQTMAGQSATHLMTVFRRLRPILQAARGNGARAVLIAHSMGNWALQAGLEAWFLHGGEQVPIFDEAILAAADERFDSFALPPLGRLSGLSRFARRISVYFSRDDAVLHLSGTINGLRRLGTNGPDNRSDTTLFPTATYRMIDCSAMRDYPFDFASSHQYYRRSALARRDLAAVIAGTV